MFIGRERVCFPLLSIQVFQLPACWRHELLGQAGEPGALSYDQEAANLTGIYHMDITL